MIINDYYQNMLLSSASYAELNPGDTGASLITSISQDAGNALNVLHPNMLVEFSGRYVVVSSYDNSGGTGLAATVFYDKNGEKYVMAIRETLKKPPFRRQ